jgi:hypothetical protein
MAVVAVVRQDRLHVAVVIDAPGVRSCGCRHDRAGPALATGGKQGQQDNQQYAGTGHRMKQNDSAAHAMERRDFSARNLRKQVRARPGMNSIMSGGLDEQLDYFFITITSEAAWFMRPPPTVLKP